MIEIRALTKALRRHRRRRQPVIQGTAGPGHRLPRAQRRRQVHHHAADRGAGPPERRGCAGGRGRRYADHPAPLRQLGALLEAKAVHKGRTAYHHLLALAQTHGIPATRVREVLELVGLASVARRRVGGFSLGMGQRLGIAAALLGDPAAVILDEPVNGLDSDGVLWVRTLLKDLAAQGAHGAGLQPPDERDGGDCRAPGDRRPRAAARGHHS